ncbi:PilZ domain-containing protein [Geomonas limicola]|nr:PilZ domain-containing protein [Geomonas limicola]
MHSLNDTVQDHPLLAISYDDNVRAVLVKNLAAIVARVEPCASFCQAEAIALEEPCRGVVVDLTAMIKAKSEEKIVAYTLAAFFPALRVRAMGPLLVPMSMPGEAQQEKSLKAFVTNVCDRAPARRLRRYKRRPICVPTSIGERRGFTLNISWGGAFIADMNPERYQVGDLLKVTLPDFGMQVDVVVRRIQCWGEHRPPGVGVEFVTVTQELEMNLRELLNISRESDHDRQIT